jgi:hypothetical protein
LITFAFRSFPKAGEGQFDLGSGLQILHQPYADNWSVLFTDKVEHTGIITIAITSDDTAL